MHRLAASTGCRGHRRPPYLRAWAEWRSPPQLRLLPSRPSALSRHSVTPGATMRTGHSGHPSAPSPPPRAPQPLRGPHHPPRRLPWPVVYLYRRRSPPPTHAIADELTGEHPSSPLPPNGPPSHRVALAVVSDPSHRQGSSETGRRHRPWPWSYLPCLCSTMGHQPMGGLLA
jgi:hypothetical protein